MNRQELKFRHDLLEYVAASSEPVLASKLVRRFAATYVETMRVLNELESKGLIDHIVDREQVRWISASNSESLRTKFLLERADDETSDDGRTSEVRQDQAGDLRSDPSSPVPEPHN